MIEQVIRLTVNVLVNEGQMDEFESIAQIMTAGSNSEPGTLGYEWFAGGDGRHFRLVEAYADASAVEAHFMGPVIQQLAPQLAAVSKTESIEFYGDPGPKVREMASGMGAVVFQYWIGMDR